MRSVNAWYGPERSLTPPEAKTYHCPVCGTENPETYYFDELLHVVGCSECLTAQDAAEWEADRERGYL